MRSNPNLTELRNEGLILQSDTQTIPCSICYLASTVISTRFVVLKNEYLSFSRENFQGNARANKGRVYLDNKAESPRLSNRGNLSTFLWDLAQQRHFSISGSLGHVSIALKRPLKNPGQACWFWLSHNKT